MKTTGVRPPATPAREAPRAEKKTGGFAKAMQEAAPSSPLPMAPAFSEAAAADAKPVRAVQLPTALEGVVEEMHVNLQGTEVNIQFDAKTLDGLNVRISREGGRLAVEMNCRSAEMSRLIAQHIPALGQALENRGYAAPVIEVRTSARSASSREKGQDQQQEGGQHKGRQR